MRLLYRGKDGGRASTVWGFWLCEFKRWFSIVLLRFEHGSREAYHTHAFDSVSWVLRGKLVEHMLHGEVHTYTPSWRPVVTRRKTFHKVVSEGRTWVLSFRGPWRPTWLEFTLERGLITLANGRVEV